MAAKRRARAPRAAGRGVKPARAGADNPSSTAIEGFQLSEIRRLIRLVQRTGIGELELSSGSRKVRIAAAAGLPALLATAAAVPGAASAPGTAAPGIAAPAAAAEKAADRHVAIVAPMVGTFYRAPAPDADPYVETGDVIEVGQTVCIVEAMKLMNEIESEVRGRVAQILVENAQPVEFGQKLFLIEPV